MAEKNIALKIAIVLAGESQTDLSARTGIERTRLNKVINGAAEPKPDEQRVLARALRRKIADLFPRRTEAA